MAASLNMSQTSCQAPVPAAVAGEIRANLARQGRTSTWLAGQIGMNSSTLSRRLSGIRGRSFTLDELVAIAATLEVPLTSLLSEPQRLTA